MDEILQQFEQPVIDESGERYAVYLYGRSRPGDTWQGWLVFERQNDGRRYATGVETTQPNRQAILYWATGLTDSYFDGAFNRARKTPRERHDRAAMQEVNLAEIEHDVLACFRFHRAVRLETRQVFDELPFAHATTTRALEDLEKHGGLLVRRTEDGTDWLYLTEAGTQAANVDRVPHTNAKVERELAKSPRR
jgi:hypothetical protein